MHGRGMSRATVKRGRETWHYRCRRHDGACNLVKYEIAKPDRITLGRGSSRDRGVVYTTSVRASELVLRQPNLLFGPGSQVRSRSCPCCNRFATLIWKLVTRSQAESCLALGRFQHAAMTDSNAAASIPTKRSYRACINCRRHKTKCDLGDVNAPASPPCSKCRRTRTECVFAPGKRGGLDKSEAKNDSERSRDMSDRPDTGLHQPRHNTTRSVNESIERDTTTPLSAINRDFSYNGVDQSSTSRLNTSPVITSNNTIHQSFSQPNISDYSASYPALRTDSANTAFIQDTQGFSRSPPSTSNPAQPSLLSVDSYQGQGLASRDPFSNGKHTGDGLSETLLATSNNQQLGQNGHDFNVDASQYILSTPLPTQDRISSHSADRGREMSVVGQAIPGDAFVGHSMDNSFDSFTHEGGPQHSSVNLLDEAGQQVEPSLRSQKQSLPRVTSRSPRQRWLGLGHNNLDRGSDTPLHRSTATLTDPRSFVINTGMHNESDALQILAMAATSSEKDKNRLGKRQRSVSDVDGLGMQRARDGFRTEIDRDRDVDHAGYDSKSQQGSSSRQSDMASPANTDGHHRSPAEVMELQRRQNAQNDEMHRNANGQSSLSTSLRSR
jgi:hypothetical protein